MAEKKVVVPPVKGSNQPSASTTQIKTTNASNPSGATKATHHATGKALFGKENFMWMIAGLVIIAIGMFLMSGGNSNDPNVFDQKEVYSTTRITVAPLLIIIGLGVEVFAIFRKPKD